MRVRSLVVTNLTYAEGAAPHVARLQAAASLNWQEVRLTGPPHMSMPTIEESARAHSTGGRPSPVRRPAIRATFGHRFL